MNKEVIKNISKEININESKIEIVINLLSEGSTIPFIARYRKEMTGYLDEEQLRTIEKLYKYNVNLDEKKEDIKRLINEKGMLNDDIIKSINESTKLSELDNIYEPFKEGKKTKGTIAIELGLEPLANEIMKFNNIQVEEIAKPYLSDEVKTIEEAINNAGYIIADRINNNVKYKKWIKYFIINNGVVKTTKKKSSVDNNKTYEIYYDFEESIQSIKSYRILAINRAAKEKIINYSLKVDEEEIINYLKNNIISNHVSPANKYVEIFILDAYKRLIEPSLEREIKTDLFDLASENGIKEFGSNLENLLLTPPIKESVVLGFDPAFRTGCKLAVVNPTGKVLEISVIYPHEPKNLIKESNLIVLELIKKYNIDIIAIGNGTASRESELFISNLIKNNNLKTKFIIVNEAGASVYSASKLAKEEFPDYSVEQRSAVSIARRLQDSLSELVKIDPKSIGVGLYQHDLKTNELDNELGFVVSKIVNEVGVNINNASSSLLSYISGLNKKNIKSIIDYREKNGKINQRNELLNINSINDKTFEQCAGFLRILDGINPLDKTNIHPEDYDLVNKILSDNKISSSLVGTKEMEELLNNIDNKIIKEKYNISNDKVEFIKNNLVNGIIDPREEMPKVTLRSDILTIDDLKTNDQLEGVVRNVLPFGAFVDIGLHDDALLHISKMSKSFISHPSEIVKVGDIITVYIDDIDKEKNRISISLIKK